MLSKHFGVGTVPIFNYVEWFDPKPVSGIHCLTFTTRAELIAQVRRVLDASELQLQTLQAQASAFYRQTLDPSAFGRRFARIPEHRAAGHVQLLLNAEGQSLERHRRNRQPTRAK